MKKIILEQEDVQEIIHQAYGRGFLGGVVATIIVVMLIFGCYRFIAPKPDYTMTQEQANALQAPSPALAEISEPLPYIVPIAHASEPQQAPAPQSIPTQTQAPRPEYFPFGEGDTPSPSPHTEVQSETQAQRNMRDRAENRDDCILLSNFMETSYAGISDGSWGPCVSAVKHQIWYRLNYGAHTGQWSHDAQILLAQYQ